MLAIMFGFILNSGLRTYYTYSWWSAEAKFSNNEMNESYEKYGYYKIVQDEMGIIAYLKYPLISGSYVFHRWGIQYP